MSSDNADDENFSNQALRRARIDLLFKDYEVITQQCYKFCNYMCTD